MYAEEYLPDDVNDYFEFSEVSIDETSTIDTETRDHRKLKEIYKKMDKDYYSYKIPFYDGETLKKQKIELYSSPLFTNKNIRNASTGIHMEHKVGSKQDDLYFTMMDVVPGTHTALNNLPRKLYYNNPEECERHLKIVLSKEIKEKWFDKFLIARAKYH